VPIGDQPSDIEKQTRNLISEYIAKPNSIILAVSPANVDLVNSEALKLARHVDALGRRTIGVLTKVDLMDHGTNALDILSGRVYPLKLGFIGVVNRSQQDIQGNKPMDEALKAEADFFKHHPAYRNIANRCGTHFLARTLNTTLMGHIRERLPDIKARLNTLMGQTQQELASYGDMHFSGKEHRGSLILQLMTRFATSFISSIDGTSSEISTKELCGGARIYYIFNSVFGSSLESVDPTSNLSALDIRTAIRNSTGPRPSLFVPEMAFDLLVKPQIKLLEIPSQRCVELVYEELIKICHTCGSTELSRFPRLQGKLIETVSDLLRERLGPTSGYVESLISIQRAYINTNHPNFLGAAAAMSNVVSAKQERERKRLIQDERERREKRRLKELGPNGVDGGEDDTETVSGETHHGRKQITKPPRSLSPPVRENGPVSLSAALNGARSTSPSRFNGQGLGNARDSFLNYFFGKDGLTAMSHSPTPSHRQISQSSDPSMPASIRREDNLALRPGSSREDDFDHRQAKGLAAHFVSSNPLTSTHTPATNRISRASRTNPRSPTARHSRLSSSGPSSPRISTSSVSPSPTRSPRLSCTSSSTTARMSCRTASSRSSTRRLSSRSSYTRTMALRRTVRSARGSSRRTGRRPRSSARSFRAELEKGFIEDRGATTVVLPEFLRHTGEKTRQLFTFDGKGERWAAMARERIRRSTAGPGSGNIGST
jgi:dynamin 1-like protein